MKAYVVLERTETYNDEIYEMSDSEGGSIVKGYKNKSNALEKQKELIYKWFRSGHFIECCYGLEELFGKGLNMLPKQLSDLLSSTDGYPDEKAFKKLSDEDCAVMLKALEKHMLPFLVQEVTVED